MTASPKKNTSVVASAHPNIALIKYWGKADSAHNVPAVGSLSITLDELATTTRIAAGPAVACDSFELNGSGEPAMAGRVFAFIDRYWPGSRPPIAIQSENNFPTAAGLASSASGFAALVVALDSLLGGSLSTLDLARRAGSGSGSAARSLFGGFVRLDTPDNPAADIDVRGIASADDFPLTVVVAITSEARKATGSTEAMRASASTSPYYASWLQTHRSDLDLADAAVAARDFEALAAVSESSCLKMHAVMQATQPALLYWNGATVECMHSVMAMRAAGRGVFFTIDAGPQVKAVCLPQDADFVSRELASIDGVKRVLRCGLGGPAHVQSVGS